MGLIKFTKYLIVGLFIMILFFHMLILKLKHFNTLLSI